MTNPCKMSISLTTDRYQAIFNHLFVCQNRALEDTPGPWVSTKFMPDTDAHFPVHQRSGWATAGSWGPVTFGGTRWPDRIMVEDGPEGAAA